VPLITLPQFFLLKYLTHKLDGWDRFSAYDKYNALVWDLISHLWFLLVLVILTMLAAMTTGSGNAPFYAFVEMIPKLAHSSGINPAYLSIPMLQASNLGRTISPVSGVVVAVAGMAKISPFEVVKRTSVPVMVGLLVVIIATEILVPGSAVH